MKKKTKDQLARWKMAKPEAGAGVRVLSRAFAELGLEEKPFTVSSIETNLCVEKRADTVSVKTDIRSSWYSLKRIRAIFESPAWCFGLSIALLWCNFIVDDAMADAIAPKRPVFNQAARNEAKIIEEELVELSGCKISWVRLTMNY